MDKNVEITPNFSVKYYNDDYIKLIWKLYPGEREWTHPGRDIHDKKLDESISRARSKIFEYAICNEWEFFVTLTLDKNKMDRYDLSEYIKKLGQWIRNQRRTGLDLKYLLIPEQHKDGAWHMHGLFNGFREQDLREFTLKENIPLYMKNLICEGRKLYDVPKYREKFGFVSVERVKNQMAISKYITKYVSKALRYDLDREKEKKLYYVSRGLKTSEKIMVAALPTAILEKATTQGKKFDYVKILDMDSDQFYDFMQSYSRYINYTTK